MSWILRFGPPGVMDVRGPHNVFEVVAVPPSAPMLCACVCSVHGQCCMHVLCPGASDPFWVLPHSSTQERRSWQMTNSPKTCSDSCNCSARGIIMVRRRGGWGGGRWRFGVGLEELPEFISSHFLPLSVMTSPPIFDHIVLHPLLSPRVKRSPPTFLNLS